MRLLVGFLELWSICTGAIIVRRISRQVSGDEIVVDIESGQVSGRLSVRALRLIEEWRLLHVEELRKTGNWLSE
jgi:hypothetical protein